MREEVNDTADAGHVEVVKAMAGHGADVNAADNSGNTAMMGAAGAGHTEVVKALAGHGADFNASPTRTSLP